MSTIGFSSDTELPPLPPPDPAPPNSPSDIVGTSTGTMTARPVAVRPILRADVQTARLLTRVCCVSKTRPLPVSCWPQCASRLSS